MNQKEAFELFSPLIEQRGKIYFKCSLVYVVCAKEGDYIETWTADGLETTNYANEGDFIVQNIQTEAQEKYIVTPDMFFQRYKFFYWSEDGAIYMPTGKVKAPVVPVILTPVEAPFIDALPPEPPLIFILSLLFIP